MAINIPQQTTLMDHLASVGRRYVQNKANLDLQREQNAFTLARDEKQQAYGLALAEGQNANALAQIKATGENTTALQKLIEQGATNRTTLTTNAEKGIAAGNQLGQTKRAGMVTKSQENIALGNQAVQREGINANKELGLAQLENNMALAIEQNMGAFERQALLQRGELALQDLRGKQTLSLAESEQEARLVELMNTLDAGLQGQKLNAKNNIDVANIGATTQRLGIQSNARDRDLQRASNIELAKLGYNAEEINLMNTLAANQQAVETQGKYGLKQAKINAKTQKYGIKQGSKVEQARIEAQNKATDRAFDLQDRQQAQIEESQNFQLEVARHNFNESQKNQYLKAIDNIMPVLEMSGVSIDDYLAAPESYSSILSKAVESNQLGRIIGSALGGSPGYETVQERQQKVNDTLQSLNFLNALYRDPALSGANGLNQIINR